VEEASTASGVAEAFMVVAVEDPMVVAEGSGDSIV